MELAVLILAAVLALLFTDAQFAALMAFFSSTVASVLAYLTRRDLNRHRKASAASLDDVKRKVDADRRSSDAHDRRAEDGTDGTRGTAIEGETA